MRVIYAFEDLPPIGTSALFLAGPTPRAPIGAPAIPSWRQDAIAFLEKIGYDGDVLIPEPRDGWRPDYDGQVEWECLMRLRADIVLFWVPRNLETMPAFTTNIEFGEDLVTTTILYGRPDDAPKNRYLDARYKELGKTPHSTLESLLEDAVATLGEGAVRENGERSVPLWIWKTESFQNWYEGVKKNGNRLDEFTLQHAFRFSPDPNHIFGWVAKVNIFIAEENRNKSNEVIFGRADTALVVPILTDTQDQDILVTQEFRSPGNTKGGLVVEPPAGSSPHTLSPVAVAAEELNEETGLSIQPDRLTYVGTKQLAATLLTHRCNVFKLFLTPEESQQVRADARNGTIFGANPEAENGERITLDILSQKDLLTSDMDWSVLGAVMASLQMKE